MKQRRIRPWLLYFAAWTPLVFGYGAALHLAGGKHFPIAAAMFDAVLAAILPMAVGIILWALTPSLPAPHRRPLFFAGTQLVLCSAFIGAWTAWQWTEMRLGARYGAIDASTARTALPWQAFIGLMLYGVLAGTTYAARQWISARDLGIAAERAERLRAQAELASLRAHISPHFLFNTLHSVIALIGSDPSLAGRALEELSELFRYVLRLDREAQDTVALEDEWEFTKRYLWLEQLRMGDRLRIEMRMDEETATSMVPPFTLQPLVENAVRHGLAPKRSGGTIRVVAQECDGSVELEVSDDGVGAVDSEPARAGGLGVRAVRQRLAAQFGVHATSRVETAPGRGYRVVLRFPCAPIGAGTKEITSYAG